MDEKKEQTGSPRADELARELLDRELAGRFAAHIDPDEPPGMAAATLARTILRHTDGLGGMGALRVLSAYKALAVNNPGEDFDLGRARSDLGAWLVSHPDWYLASESGEKPGRGFVMILGHGVDPEAVVADGADEARAIRHLLERAITKAG